MDEKILRTAEIDARSEQNRSGVTTSARRDARVDLLRGFALVMVFIDHTSRGYLGQFTMRNFGFSDASELFVLLAGFSAARAYGGIFDRDGFGTGLRRVGRRVLSIYGAQSLLFLSTLGILVVWSMLFDFNPRGIRPLLDEGWYGILRGLTLTAMPVFLDILPLYIVLLLVFPIVWLGARRSLCMMLLGSASLYVTANVTHINLTNAVDPAAPLGWAFNPFAWQLVFCCGVAGAVWMVRPRAEVPRLLFALGASYLLFAFVIVDGWHLWPAPFGSFSDGGYPFSIFGNEPKSFCTPWRLLHVLAIAVVALQSTHLLRFATSRWAVPIIALGRHSLAIFALGCLLALFGRLIFVTISRDLAAVVLVDTLGLGAMLVVGIALDQHRRRGAAKRQRSAAIIGPDVPALV